MKCEEDKHGFCLDCLSGNLKSVFIILLFLFCFLQLTGIIVARCYDERPCGGSGVTRACEWPRMKWR